MGGDRRRLVARRIWGVFACAYAVSLIGAGYAGSAFPLLTTVLLAVTSILFAAVFWSRQRRPVLVALAAAALHAGLAVLLLGRSATRDGALGGAIGTGVWLFALILPIAVAVHALIALRRAAGSVAPQEAG